MDLKRETEKMKTSGLNHGCILPDYITNHVIPFNNFNLPTTITS